MPENPRSGETAAGGDEASPGRTATRRWAYSPVPFLWFVAIAAALALAVTVTALELGAIVPGLGLFSAIGSFVIPLLAPLLVIAALPAIGLGLGRRRRRPRRHRRGRSRHRGRGHGHRHHRDHDFRGRRRWRLGQHLPRARAILGHGS